MIKVARLTAGWQELMIELGSVLPFVVGFLLLLVLINTGQGVELIAISQQSDSIFFEEFVHSFPALLCGIVSISLLVEMREVTATRQLHTKIGWFAKLRIALIASATPALIAHSIGMKAGFLLSAALLLIYAVFSQSNFCTRKIRVWIMAIAILLVFLGAIVVAHYSTVAQKLGTIGVVVTSITLWATLATLLFGYLPVKYFKTQPVYFFH